MSVVAFTQESFGEASEQARQKLQNLGFRLPTGVFIEEWRKRVAARPPRGEPRVTDESELRSQHPGAGAARWYPASSPRVGVTDVLADPSAVAQPPGGVDSIELVRKGGSELL